MSNSPRPKILCLGVSYPDIVANQNVAQISSIKHQNDNLFMEKTTTTSSADIAIQCVQQKVLNQMDGRDLARCLATEDICHVDVYCVSQEDGAIYRSDRHVHANFNRRTFIKLVQQQVLKIIMWLVL